MDHKLFGVHLKFIRGVSTGTLLVVYNREVKLETITFMIVFFYVHIPFYSSSTLSA